MYPSPADWTIKGTERIISPLVEAMESALYGHDYLHIDETTLQVLRKEGRAAKWSPNNNSLKNQMRLTAMSYNQLRVFEEISKIQDSSLIHPSDKKYTQSLKKKQKASKRKGALRTSYFSRKESCV